jgi:hypothetical protein
MDSLGLERLVATLVSVGKTDRVGKGLSGRCSRIVTDQLDVFGQAKHREAVGPLSGAGKQDPSLHSG